MEFCKHKLPNGLEVVAECNGRAHSTALGFFVRTGARDETDAVAGGSHFLEHMVFKGTATQTADEVNGRFDELGADYNAWTGKENTTYHAIVLPEYQNEIIELWADLMRPALREDDFDTEKQVIIEEIRMYADQPPFTADEKCEQSHYGKHPLGNSVLGTVESIRDLTVEAMGSYFRQRYSPSNITLAGCGRVDFDGLVDRAERSCGHWERFEAGRRRERPVFHQAFHVVCREAAVQQYALSLAHGRDQGEVLQGLGVSAHGKRTGGQGLPTTWGVSAGLLTRGLRGRDPKAHPHLLPGGAELSDHGAFLQRAWKP